MEQSRKLRYSCHKLGDIRPVSVPQSTKCTLMHSLDLHAGNKKFNTQNED